MNNKILDQINELNKDPSSFIIKNDLQTLIDILKYANELYHNNQSIISDNMYDILYDIIKDIEPNNKILNTIGSNVLRKKVKLPHYMGSMNKIKSDNLELLNKWLTKYKSQYVYSDKLDGVSALLYNNNDKLCLVTRGNGNIGMNISGFIKYIKTINNIKIPNNYAIRGELIMSKENFNKYKINLKPEPSNARNMVSGIINSKKINKYIEDIDFVAYELVYPWNNNQLYQWKELNKLKFKVVEYQVIDNININILKEILIKRKKYSEYEIDGIIISSNELPLMREINNNPSYAFAFKDTELLETAEVKVLEVMWNISKDGYIKPKLKCEPVKLNNVVITYITAFNAKYIKDNILGPGAIIKIIRSGDVIPHIISIIKGADNNIPQFPNYNYVWSDSKIDIIIKDETKQQKIKELTFFCKKLNIKDINEKIIEKFINNGIDNILKIINIKQEDLKNIEGFKEKMITKIYNNIKNSISNITLLNFAIASNYFGHGLGSKKLESIMNEYPNIIELYNNNSYEEIINKIIKIKGFEIKTAKQFTINLDKFNNLFNSLDNNLKKKLIDSCCIKNSSDMIFKDMIIVFSGFRDEKLEEYIKNNGGKITLNVSSNTSILVTTKKAIEQNTNIKIIKAKELNIIIMTKEKFENKYYIK